MLVQRAAGLALILAAAGGGCASVRAYLPAVPGRASAATTEVDLHAALGDWASSFQSTLVAACDQIRSATKERDPRRNCLLWQIRMVPLATQAAFHADPQQSYVAVLALASAQEEYLRDGDGKALFAALQPVAREAAQHIEDDAIEVGRRFLSGKQLARLQTQVDELVQRHPIRGVFAADALIAGFADPSSQNMFSWVIDLPMVPFRALSGVSDTAQSIHAFNETAQEFTETVGALPQQTRWQLELLLYDAEELEAVDRALDAADAVAGGADRIAGVAEMLPEQLGAELAARLEETRGTLAELDAALARAESLTGPLTHVSDRIGDASAQWTALLTQMRENDSGESDGRPFDVREYGSAADQIGSASQQVLALLTELRSGDGATGRALLDELTWRAGALIVLFFVSLVAYRFVASRFR